MKMSESQSSIQSQIEQEYLTKYNWRYQDGEIFIELKRYKVKDEDDDEEEREETELVLLFVSAVYDSKTLKIKYEPKFSYELQFELSCYAPGCSASSETFVYNLSGDSKEVPWFDDYDYLINVLIPKLTSPKELVSKILEYLVTRLNNFLD
jgi:hypothetical protein